MKYALGQRKTPTWKHTTPSFDLHLSPLALPAHQEIVAVDLPVAMEAVGVPREVQQAERPPSVTYRLVYCMK